MLNRRNIGESRIVGILLMNVFLVLFVNNVYFQHVHILSDGTLILHAHPFNKTEGGPLQHKHSNAEFCSLSGLGLYINNERINADFGIKEVNHCFTPIVALNFYEANINCTIGRSPPIVSSFLIS